METINIFSKEEINFELQRTLNFPLLKSSPVLTSFLSYIVTETIEGRDRHIKEYSIAVNALNRDEDFDSHEDAVVRIHAGRLRRILNEYYLTKGVDNPINISIPKGCYVPLFTQAGKKNINRTASENGNTTCIKPVLALFPFKLITQNQNITIFSQLLEEELRAELSRFKDICVIGYFSKGVTKKINDNILEAGKSVGANHIITGLIRHNKKHVHIRTNLLITSTGEIVITKTLDLEVRSNLLELQDEITEAIIAAVGNYFGIFFP